MMIQTSEALELCSESEWELIEHSFYPMVAMLPRSALKSRLGRARKLHMKNTDLLSLRRSEPHKRTTLRKVEMLAEAIDRFEGTLKVLENAQSFEPAPKDVPNQRITEETRTLNMSALERRANQEPANRKSPLLSALALHGIQQKRRSRAVSHP